MQTISELMDLHDKVAIVTGGAKGIGQAIVYRLAEAGAHVLVADIDETAAQATAEVATKQGNKAQACSVNVGEEVSVRRMFDTCEKHFAALDILVNNAGIYPNIALSDMTLEDFEKVLHVNLEGVFLATKYAAERMKRTGNGGRIINITSIDALHPSMPGLAHYDASKHGVWGLTKNVALELAPHHIWVNAIAPGGIKTPGTTGKQTVDQYDPEVAAFLRTIPMQRMGEADEIATVALFLASDLSSYMTGSQIVVDGGALLT